MPVISKATQQKGVVITVLLLAVLFVNGYFQSVNGELAAALLAPDTYVDRTPHFPQYTVIVILALVAAVLLLTVFFRTSLAKKEGKMAFTVLSLCTAAGFVLLMLTVRSAFGYAAQSNFSGDPLFTYLALTAMVLYGCTMLKLVFIKREYNRLYC